MIVSFLPKIIPSSNFAFRFFALRVALAGSVSVESSIVVFAPLDVYPKPARTAHDLIFESYHLAARVATPLICSAHGPDLHDSDLAESSDVFGFVARFMPADRNEKQGRKLVRFLSGRKRPSKPDEVGFGVYVAF